MIGKLLSQLSKLLWIFSLLLVAVLAIMGDGGCRVLDFLKCIHNTHFTGHVIETFRIPASGLRECGRKCYIEEKCVSYNLGPVQGVERSCELNDADHVSHPAEMLPSHGFKYCPVKNHCLSNPCPSGTMCRPDFSWDTFTCDVDGGWAPWTTWTTCQSHPASCPRKRNRTCSNPPPLNRGAYCIGPGLESKTCVSNVNASQRECELPLGMEDGNITDSQITASSTYPAPITLDPWQARLKNPGITGVTYGSWAARIRSAGQYLQIDLGCPKMITRIATQGRSLGANQYVTKYSVSYSNDTTNWIHYQQDGAIKVFPGNNDKQTIVKNSLPQPLIARYIRIIVEEFYSWPTMRMELYGCSF